MFPKYNQVLIRNEILEYHISHLLYALKLIQIVDLFFICDVTLLL